VLLDGGKVIASGPHTLLLAEEPRYREVLAAMAAEDDQPEPAAALTDDDIVEGIVDRTSSGGD
jgi:hypothetical protein